MLSTLWYSEKVRNWALQLALLGLFAGTLYWLFDNTVSNLVNRGIPVGFDFLWRSASFPISESLLSYSPSDTFFWAYVVGLSNTLFISIAAILLSTVLGVFVGLARRSQHPMISTVSGVFVTTVRNMPLIVHLLFWYALATTVLPAARSAYSPLQGVFISLRGLYFPDIDLHGQTGLFFALAALGLIAFLFWYRRGRTSSALAAVIGGYGLFLGLAALLSGITATVVDPKLTGFNFSGGFRLSIEFMSLMVGLVIYTSAYIGEIIRGGIDAVGKGQSEAGRSLGLSERQTLVHIIFPQALRIIIPPLTTQYLSTVKNTTLALAVGYPELGLVVGTVINQTGQAIESILIMLCAFLTVSLSVSLFMNWYNRKVALVQR